MMKFFRKNTKYMLAILMALLLVVWLLEDTLANLGRGGEIADREWGQVYGRAISTTSEEFRLVQKDISILDRLGIPWRVFWMPLSQPRSMEEYQYLQFLSQLRSSPLTVDEWFMLDTEARRRGVYVPDDRVAQVRQAMPPEMIEGVSESLKVSFEAIDHAIESFLRIQQVYESETARVELSEATIQSYLRDTGEKARVKLAVLNPEQFVDPSYEPAPEEIQTQFDKYKDRDKADGPAGENYGYRLPEEAQIEYIAVHVASVGEKQQVNDDDAHSYWKEHQAEFLAPATQPTTSPASRPARKPYDTYTEARAEVINKLKMERAKRETLSIATEIARSLGAPWLNQPTTQPGGYREPPASALAADLYSGRLDEFRKRFGEVVTYERQQYHTESGFSMTGQAGRATAPAGSGRIALRQAAFLVQGLSADRNARPDYVNFFHNLYETVAEPFVDSEGNAYVFRTIGIRPKRAPESLEMVKNDVVQDLRRRKAAEVADAKAQVLAEQAKKLGLEEAIEQDADLKLRLGMNPVATPAPFARLQSFGMGRSMPSFVPSVGSDKKFLDAVFAMAGSTATQPSRVILYEADSKQQWVIVELVDFIPLTQEEYAQQRELHSKRLQFQWQMTLAREWLSAANIRKRVQWKSSNPEEEKPEEPADDMTLLN